MQPIVCDPLNLPTFEKVGNGPAVRCHLTVVWQVKIWANSLSFRRTELLSPKWWSTAQKNCHHTHLRNRLFWARNLGMLTHFYFVGISGQVGSTQNIDLHRVKRCDPDFLPTLKTHHFRARNQWFFTCFWSGYEATDLGWFRDESIFILESEVRASDS